jgi:hypothetical protein
LPKVAHTAAEDAECRRLAISHGDIDEAVGFIASLGRLDRGAPDFVALRDALLLAFLVAYARPFKRNAKGDGTLRQLSLEGLAEFSSEQKRVHEFLLRIRDQQFAHSDPSPLRLNIDQQFSGAMTVYMQDVRPPISDEAVRTYLALAEGVRRAVADRLRDLGVVGIVREG